MRLEDLARRAFDTASVRGAHYADIRFENVRNERIEVRNGVVASLADARSTGYGVRALVDGAWGFAASSDLTDAGIDTCTARAVAIARASASIARSRFGEAPHRAYIDSFETPLARDPQQVPLGERVALLLE
ncbi:MAG TPA: DNA gyrase modulator, partial [Candidatus Acidoferrales bacterium]|nr:DNA gyrase modulator [Candidatus Acidoferrales bacterium]